MMKLDFNDIRDKLRTKKNLRLKVEFPILSSGGSLLVMNEISIMKSSNAKNTDSDFNFLQKNL